MVTDQMNTRDETMTLKSRLWTEFKICCHDAWWEKRGVVLTFRDITGAQERAVRIAEKTQCDVIHLSDTRLLIENFK